MPGKASMLKSSLAMANLLQDLYDHTSQLESVPSIHWNNDEPPNTLSCQMVCKL